VTPVSNQAAAHLCAAVDRLVARVGHWSPNRWAAYARADRVFALAQQLADAGADTEGLARRPVPRLEHDASLVDQVRVLAADLIRADAPDDVLETAAARIIATTSSL
jgi:hypothetical protein